MTAATGSSPSESNKMALSAIKVLLLLAGLTHFIRCSGAYPMDSGFRAGKSRRHHPSNYAYGSYENPCQAGCEAQFRRDFQDSLHKSYEADFFDFPIDALVTQSNESFHTFCRLVEEKSQCLREECDQPDVPITPQTNICIQQRHHFEQAIGCLNKTAPYLQCHAGCSKAARRSLTITDANQQSGSYFESELNQFIVPEMQSYETQDLRCRFQACALECRKQLVRDHCASDEQLQTIQTITRYYSSDLGEDQQLFHHNGNSRLFPKFCGFLLAHWTNDTAAQLQMKAYEPSFTRTLGVLRKVSQARYYFF